MTSLIGKSLQNGKYTLTEELGRGGFGITFKAVHQYLHQVVVIKTLNEAYQSESSKGVKHRNRAEFERKFQDEARRLAMCVHPNIVRVSDFFIEADVSYMVMDYIPGETLEEVVFPAHPLPEAIAIHYIRQIGAAIRVVHQNGLLHRDIKPQNIILREGTQEVVLIDFGIAREFTPGSMQTHTNMISVGYAPIEQYLAHDKRTPATDVYGLAATLYALVTAEVPVASVLRQHQPMPEPRQLQRRLSASTNQAILRGMALDAQHRPATVDAWLALLSNSISANSSAVVIPSERPRSVQPQPNAEELTQNSETLPPPLPATVAVPKELRSAPTASPQAEVLPPNSDRKPSRAILILMAVSGLTLVGVTIAAVWLRSQPEPAPIVATSPTPTVTPSSSPSVEATPDPPPQASPSPVAPSPSPTPPPSPEPTATPDSSVEQILERPSSSAKTSSRIPGFPIGTSVQEVQATLGQPVQTKRGYWGDTQSALYEPVPNQISLAYLFDRTSGQVRQTEASFAPSVDSLVMQVTVNGMLGSQAPPDVLAALKRVARRQTSQYTFEQGGLEGVIERNSSDRVYIGIWDADLH
ncbi:MAG: protein kinase [Myxacorys chilensis ATA2-1-KO14]|jgi:serine/threonine-protein kinase|nr:protein kinase [Myxacorys chilensis ATA2-1-KO14]